ncbi:MAG: 4'-phosphopantetheinyl transferase superfamily protein [Rudaea sp.]|uniref:4'-phosphopantetheinyl transferase family protein n=1 Tax=Rudaea sp. TaxID=2136325 RepID=UPI0039E372BD
MRTLRESDFVAATPPAALGDDEIHLWIFPHCGNGAAAKPVMHRHLSETLAAYLGGGANDLRLERDDAGKPHLAGAELQFNLSHSHEMLLIGLSRSQPLGVDIECGARLRPWPDIARRYFTAEEAAALAALPADRLPRSFLALWSAKEAVLKAIGRGIAFGLDRVGFALDANGIVQDLSRLGEEAETPRQWQIAQIALANAVGALAWRGPEKTLRAFVVANGDESP